MSQPVGVILAAGLATRMGRPKQLLPFGDTTVLGSVIAAARASRLEKVILVLGAYGDVVLTAVDVADVDVVHNPDPERGNLSSLLVAAAAAEEAPLLLLMGDMPGIDSAVIDAHLAAWEESPAPMRITGYADGRGHPFLLSPGVVGRLSELEGPKPLWALTREATTEVLAVDHPMPVDVDTPEDYGAALARDALEPRSAVAVTEMLFWDDAYLTTITTVVAKAAPEEVTLEQTIFYAFAGGQERDHGTIAEREVLDARWDGADIVYRLAPGHGLNPGDVVDVRIDAARRERLRRLHMATEIVLQLIYQDDPFLAKIGAHIAPEKARIDFSSTTPLTERLPRIEESANLMVDTDVEIITAFSDAAARRRYWEIPGWARVPCAGTLPRRTGEIGPVELRRKNPGMGKERVEITLVPRR